LVSTFLAEGGANAIVSIGNIEASVMNNNRGSSESEAALLLGGDVVVGG
jgi:hypothetical protein